MFGHRGIWHQGWKAVAFHPMGSKFEDDTWELYHLETDFAETHDLAATMPDKLQQMIALWWQEAEAHQVLPLDDRFAARFAANGERVQGGRTSFVFHHGMGHVPTDVAPDLRSRSYRIEATATIPDAGAEGVLIAHGDATSGYSLYIKDGRLVHDLNIGGEHAVVTSDRPVPSGDCRLGVTVQRLTREKTPKIGTGTGRSRYTLLINGEPAGSIETPLGFAMLVSWSGLDIGLDRGSPVSDYAAPFSFTGLLAKVTVTMDSDQTLDGAGVGRAEMARQ
jgi:arylsulfatase